MQSEHDMMMGGGGTLDAFFRSCFKKPNAAIRQKRRRRGKRNLF